MPRLSFTVESAAPAPCSAAPELYLSLRVTTLPAGEPVKALLLRCQVRIEAAAREYDARETEALGDLFGAPAGWSRSLRSLLWINTSVAVPAFSGTTLVELALPCSYDFSLATTKLFAALEDGAIPLTLLFSGTLFHDGSDGNLQTAPLPWSQETTFSLPIALWRETLALHFGDRVPLPLPRALVDRLQRHQRRRGLPSWEATLEQLLVEAGES